MKFLSIVLAATLVCGSSPAIAQIGSECASAEDCLQKGLEIYFGDDPHSDAVMLYLRRATEYNPNFALAWYNIGIVRNEIGQHARAIEAYETAIDMGEDAEWGTVDPMSAWNNLGVAQARLERYEEARNTFQRVVQVLEASNETDNPTYDNARNNLRWVEAQLETE